MYPYHHHHHMGGVFRRCSRGPSRLLWFFLGSVTTVWWYKHHEIKHQNGYYGHCFRPPIQQYNPTDERPGITKTINNIPPAESIPQPQSWMPQSQSVPNLGPQSKAPAESEAPPPPTEQWSYGFSSQQHWDEEKARLLALGKQASDTMADISESTLDNILTAVEGLKAKLADQKALRNKQKKELDEQLEREKKAPIRYV